MTSVGEEVKKVYEKIADKYDKELWNDMPYNNELDKFAELINGDSVLDIGCAMGSFTKYIKDKGFYVDGIDFSENFISIAKEKVKDVNFYVMDMLDIKLNKKYDGIMLINSMIHVEKKNMLKLFKDIKSLLNENGVVFIILQEGEGEKYVTEPLDDSIVEFVNFYKTDEFEEIIKSAGFKIISSHKIRDDAEFELGNDQLVYYLK